MTDPPLRTAPPLWTAAEAIEATGGRCAVDWTATGVSIDSRSLAPGDLFVALKGPTHDGHDHVRAALTAGAAAVMAHRLPDACPADAAVLLVDDTLAALTRLGAAARARSSARFIGVTGSVGKTGTKEALRLCLGAQAPTHASAASFNNHWGVPLSLARMPRDSVYGVFELGMSHAGEIRELAKLVRPEVAVITTVQPVHLAFFDSVFDIADAKAEIFEAVPATGAAILNRDNPLFPHLADSAERAGLSRILTFGRHPDARFRVLESALHATRSTVQAEIEGAVLDYCLSMPGEHWVSNSLAVLAAVSAVGADVSAAAGELSCLRAMPGRGERQTLALPDGDFLLIDESYNANPSSMRAAIAVLARSETQGAGRRIAVLGDMLELGESSGEMHAGLARPLAEANIERVFTCGSEMRALFERLDPQQRGAHRATAAELADLVATAVMPGDVVMVKGSLGQRMAKVVQALKTPASEAAEPARKVANGE